MDFSFSDEQLAVSEAASGVFAGLVDPERVGAVEQRGDQGRIDREVWQALAAADLLGLAVPQSEGGAGHGLLELGLLLEAQGNVVAPVPLWATLVLGALPIAHFGSDDQRARWLPGVVGGDIILTAALNGAALSPTATPAVVARAAAPGGGAGAGAGGSGADEAGWVLDGVELAVPHAQLAQRVVVPAHCADAGGVLLALVDPRAEGVTLERTVTTNREIHPHVRLSGVVVAREDVLVGPDMGRSALDFVLTAATIGLCALQVGVCEAALRQTAAYLNTRHQFGRPLSTFQGTMLRAADAAIDIEAMRVTWQNAAWRFDTGRDAAEAARVAKWQASERGQRAVHATQHLHGGMGADVTYPIHRYFLWGKQIELMLGGPSAQLARLGSQIAEQALARAEAGAGAAAGTQASAAP
jgi:alkylation response protein AidB-like acyl-CoA dehydrogenase